MEERCVLRHDSDRLSQRLELDVLDVLPINRDAAAAGVVEAEEEAEHGRLSAPTRADDGDLFARGDREGDVLEDWSIRVVAERNVFKSDLAAVRQRQRLRVRVVLSAGTRDSSA